MKHYGGRGTLLSGVPGVAPGNVVILGAGVAGVNAARIAVGVGADVTVMDTKQERLRTIDDTFQGRLKTIASNAYNIENVLKRCDLLIGAVHIPGARTPRLVTRQMLGFMKKGAVIVDVSVDQGGCVETIRGTTHSNPTYEVDGIVHYGVANMPGAVPRTATFALTNATLPYVLALADKALKAACVAMPGLAKGINLYNGCVTHRSVAQAIGRDFTPLPFL
jgi:alanine dehydrogenase